MLLISAPVIHSHRLDWSGYSLLTSGSPSEALEFCLKIINATAEFAACFKPNSAFFEQLGPAGMEALDQVINLVFNHYFNPDPIPQALTLT